MENKQRSFIVFVTLGIIIVLIIGGVWYSKIHKTTLTFGNEYFQLNILNGWSVQKLSDGAVSFTKNGYLLMIYPKVGSNSDSFQAITLIGNMIGPKLVNRYSYWAPCGTYTQENISSTLVRTDQFVKSSKNLSCNFPTDGKVHWYLSLTTTGEKTTYSGEPMYLGEATKVSPISNSACGFKLEETGCGFLIAMTYQGSSLNDFPMQDSPGLIQMLGEMSSMVKTIQFKEQPALTKPIDVGCTLASFAQYNLKVSPTPIQLDNGESQKFGVKTEACFQEDNLNGNGKIDSVVFTATANGNGGTIHEMAFIASKNGQPYNIATELLPDRTDISNIDVDAGIISIYVKPLKSSNIPWHRINYRLDSSTFTKISDDAFDYNYQNDTYGFIVAFPQDWKGMSVKETADTNGHYITFQYPNQDVSTTSRQWIPISIYSYDVWNKIQKGEIVVSAAPFPPGEIGRNAKWVFALPPRWVGFADATHQKEAQVIVGTLSAF
jgi:hypothetical protein